MPSFTVWNTPRTKFFCSGARRVWQSLSGSFFFLWLNRFNSSNKYISSPSEGPQSRARMDSGSRSLYSLHLGTCGFTRVRCVRRNTPRTKWFCGLSAVLEVQILSSSARKAKEAFVSGDIPQPGELLWMPLHPMQMVQDQQGFCVCIAYWDTLHLILLMAQCSLF